MRLSPPPAPRPAAAFLRERERAWPNQANPDSALQISTPTHVLIPQHTLSLRYLEPLQAFLSGDASTPPQQRLVSFVDASRRVYESFAFTDSNAAVMYGLALLSLGFYSKTELADGSPHMRLAAALQQQVLISSPTHPGALHFLIHAVDQPTSGPSSALAAAQAYFDSNSRVRPSSCTLQHQSS